MTPIATDNPEGSPVTEFRIDLARLQRIMHIGVRRAAGFMLLGLSAAENQDVGKSAFDPQKNKFRWRYFPELMTDQVIGEVQSSFKQWVIECGLRELDQHCSIFCDQIYEILVFVELPDNRVTEAALHRIHDFVGRTSVGGKLQTISGEFEIEVGLAPHIQSLTLARNCLAHSVGRVSRRNSNSEEGLTLSWNVLNLYLGSVQLTDEVLPYRIEKDQVIEMRVETQRRLVRLGERIVLQPHELLEICWNYQSQTDHLVKAVENILRAKGIPIPPAKSD